MGVIYTKIYDKRDIINFPVVNFPILSGNIPLTSSYGVFIGELVVMLELAHILRTLRKELFFW